MNDVNIKEIGGENGNFFKTQNAFYILMVYIFGSKQFKLRRLPQSFILLLQTCVPNFSSLVTT